MPFITRWLASLVLCLLLAPVAAADSAPPPADAVWILNLKGAVGPASSDYLVRGLEQAARANARAVVLRIDTPGGLDLSMRSMISAVLASPVPVIGYVAPGGARAASAGTYLLYSCHVAAMAPATNLGAATPVSLGGGTPSFDPEPDDDPVTPQRSGSALERKIVNDAVAYIRSLAELRGRNADWAEQAVREGSSLSAEQALEQQVIDLIAPDLEQLLAALEGRDVELDGRTLSLQLSNAPRVEFQPDWRTDFLAVITNPNVAYLLMLIGIYGLIFEFSNPGFGVPGVLGLISLMVALYAFQVLPISYAGLGLMLLGIGLIIAEAYAPSFGILGVGGAIAFIVGSIMLMDTELPAYQLAWPVVAAVGLTTVMVVFGVVSMALRARSRPQSIGVDAARGQTLAVAALQDGEAMVRFESELWPVRCAQALQPGDRVRVTGSAGLHLLVDKEES
ncbi:NfeD family protein [Marinobacterium weihaiense]|uniref:Nodulation protein NfeD n=1 Tax=Marinobacterium weihaiense TaxID=2851016 RepID=A0ABS6MAP2_9GAMM|nr:nodulation protein NfeD [Marinobacterium weihaiense]MBV0933367.1 nodulation protein NfeD [Marinobacterium weihaiense]